MELHWSCWDRKRVYSICQQFKLMRAFSRIIFIDSIVTSIQEYKNFWWFSRYFVIDVYNIILTDGIEWLFISLIKLRFFLLRFSEIWRFSPWKATILNFDLASRPTDATFSIWWYFLTISHCLLNLPFKRKRLLRIISLYHHKCPRIEVMFPIHH